MSQSEQPRKSSSHKKSKNCKESQTKENPPKTKLLAVQTLQGPLNQEVKVQYYLDGSIRFRVIGAGPMALTESFLSGKEKDVVLRLLSLEDFEDNFFKNMVQRLTKEEDIWGLALDEITGEIKCTLATAQDPATEIHGKLVYQSDLPGEPHAQIQVACPGHWEFLKDGEEEKHLNKQKTASRGTKTEFIHRINYTDLPVRSCEEIDVSTGFLSAGALGMSRVKILSCASANSLHAIWKECEKISKGWLSTPMEIVALEDNTYILPPEPCKYCGGTICPQNCLGISMALSGEKGADGGTIHRILYDENSAADGSLANILWVESRHTNDRNYQSWADLFSNHKDSKKQANHKDSKKQAYLKPKAGQGVLMGDGTVVNILRMPTALTETVPGDPICFLEAVALIDDTYILPPDEKTGIIHRIKQEISLSARLGHPILRKAAEEDARWEYLEARCLEQDNYQDWADLFEEYQDPNN